MPDDRPTVELTIQVTEDELEMILNWFSYAYVENHITYGGVDHQLRNRLMKIFKPDIADYYDYLENETDA